MIDIELDDIFFPIADKIREEFPGSYVTGEYVRQPSQFPHVSIVEIDNYMTQSRLDSSNREKYSTVVYEVNVYSNKIDDKKQECRSIMMLIDGMMYDLNFKRLSMAPIPNMEDATIYRIVARYRAETDGTRMFRR